MTIDRITRIREFCVGNAERNGQKVFEIIRDSKDVDGGLNFEEEIEQYKIGPDGWICESRIDKTIQPETGSTITRHRNERTYAVQDNNVLEILETNPETLQQFLAFERTMVEQRNIH